MGKNIKANISSYKDKYINGKYRDNKNKIAPIKTVLESAHLTAEKTLVKLMTINREYYNIIKSRLYPKDFLNYECNTMVNIIYDAYERNQELDSIDSEYIIKNLETKNDIDSIIIDEIIGMNVDFLSENKDYLIEELIKTIKYYNLKFKREQIANEIREIETNKDKKELERLKALCLELTKLDKELKAHI